MTLNQLQLQGFLYQLPIWIMVAGFIGYMIWQENK